MLNVVLLLFSLLFCSHSFSNESVMEVVPLNNRPASEIQALLYPLLEDSERIIDNHSSLIIKASPARQKELKQIIQQLDKRLNNLLISVIQSKTQTAQALNASARLNINVTDNRLLTNGRARYANTQGMKNSNSQQQITTLDGKAAYIKTGKTYPVNNSSISYSPYGYPVISNSTQFIEASTGFLVTPRLSGKQVTIEITPWSDNMNNSGQLNTQSEHTTTRVNLGEWVEIGGIEESRQSSANSLLSHHYSTSNNNMRIMIKVDKQAENNLKQQD